MKRSWWAIQIIAAVAMSLLLSSVAAASAGTSKTRSKKSTPAVKESSTATKKASSVRKKKRKVRRARRRYVPRYKTSSYAASGLTDDDIIEGEDPLVRAAAIDALGNMNGTVVAIDPDSGRILAMVNQKMALSSAVKPCSTIKMLPSLAALTEGLVTQEEEITIGRGRRAYTMNMTRALAVSNNPYFEVLGRRVGFAKVRKYAQHLGLGEPAGYDIQGESVGTLPKAPPARGGVGRMCSFGEGIEMTALQLGAMVSAFANGGTLYFLQHPHSPAEIAAFRPMVKRQLEFSPEVMAQVLEGMSAAVTNGSARSVLLNFNEEEVLGKTGTCSNDGTRYGWFASYANTQYGRIVLVVQLQGGAPTYGPRAAEISGRIYRSLYDGSYFAARDDQPRREAVGAASQ